MIWNTENIYISTNCENSISIKIKTFGGGAERTKVVRSRWWDKILNRPIGKKAAKAKDELIKWGDSINKSFEGWELNVEIGQSSERTG